MKTKSDRDKSTAKKPYVGPRISVIQPEGAQASRLADTIAGASRAKVEEITTNSKSRSSKVKKRKLPRSA